MKTLKIQHKTSRGFLTVAEAGARVGNSTLTKHGVDHLRSIGKKGGQNTIRRYGSEQMRKWGTLGGRPAKLTLKEIMEGENRHLKKEASGGQPSVSPPPPL